MGKRIMAAKKIRIYLDYIDIVWRENNWEVISNSFIPQDMVQEKKKTKQNRQFKIEYNHNLKSGSPPKNTTI